MFGAGSKAARADCMTNMISSFGSTPVRRAAGALDALPGHREGSCRSHLSVVGEAISRFEVWLRQPDQFEWVSEFLRQRNLLRSARVLMTMVSASSALAPISALAFLHNPRVSVVIVGIAGAGVAGAMTYCWLTRWPTRRQSLTAALAGTLCVSAWSLIQPRPAIAALACTALAITGGYIAFFHNTRALLLNMLVALGITAVAVYRLAAHADWPTAIAGFWIVWLLNLAVPLAVRGMSQSMAEYAMRAEQDALTGLLNRRGFEEALRGRLSASLSDARPVSLLMVDLDNFKRVNDTHGHVAGDRALTHVAELLRSHMPATAAICRAGGEEFLPPLPRTQQTLPPPRRDCARRSPHRARRSPPASA